MHREATPRRVLNTVPVTLIFVSIFVYMTREGMDPSLYPLSSSESFCIYDIVTLHL
jgi:hypothetical protein